MKYPPLTQEIVDAQADLQTALGMHRCEMDRTLCGFDVDGAVRENYMARALARLQAALAEHLDVQMMHPAIHPDVPHNHDPRALKDG